MKRITLYLLSIITFSLIGCDNSKVVDYQIEAMKAELEQIKAEYSDLKNVHPNKIDRNGDGDPDLFIEVEGDFIYELYDRDFDGRVDESWKYDSNDVLILGKVDENFDGILETQHQYKNHSLDKVFSDTNKNGVFDIYTKLDRGVVLYSEKYYGSNQNPKIGRVNYLYGHPTGPETFEDTTISEEEFEKKRNNAPSTRI